MAGKKQSGCQHLSPKTGNWEPCVGPDNCDYKKQGLDVPHAYSQAEREAIDAQRAGVDDAGLGGSAASVNPYAESLGMSDSVAENLSPEVKSEIDKRLEARSEYGVAHLSDSNFGSYIPNIDGAVVKVTDNGSVQNLLITNSSAGLTEAYEGIDLDTGKKVGVASDLSPSTKGRSVEVVDYPNTPGNFYQVMDAGVVKEYKDNSQEFRKINDDIRNDLNMPYEIGNSLDIFSYGPHVEISGHINGSKNHFTYVMDREGNLLNDYSSGADNDETRKVEDYLKSPAGMEIARRAYDAKRKESITELKQDAADMSRMPDDGSLYYHSEKNKKQMEKNLGYKIHNLNMSLQNRRDAALSVADKEIESVTPNGKVVRIARDKDGTFRLHGTDKLTGKSDGSVALSYFSPTSDNSGPKYLQDAAKRMSSVTRKEIYDSHNNKDFTIDDIKPMYPSLR